MTRFAKEVGGKKTFLEASELFLNNYISPPSVARQRGLWGYKKPSFGTNRRGGCQNTV